MLAQPLANKRGQILPLTAIIALLLVAMAGLAIDGGLLMERKRRAQTAADAAAMAAAADVFKDPTVSNETLLLSAQASAALNGFTHNPPDLNVTIARPPTGYYAGQANFVEAVVTEKRETVMLRVLKFWRGYDHTDTASVRARAVAGPRLGGEGACIHLLDDRAGTTGLEMTGSASINMPGCALQINSPGGSALKMSGGSIVAEEINIVGGANTGGNPVSPAPTTGASPLADPFATKAAPTWSACDPTKDITPGDGAHLTPGVYCGGITPSGTVTMAPGTYILVDKGITMSGGNTLIGEGVTVFITASASKMGSCTQCQMRVNGGDLIMSAPKSGEMEGMLIWVDRNVHTDPLKPDEQITGGTNTTKLEGILYFPDSKLTFTGNGGCPSNAKYTVIVAAQMKMTGPSCIPNDFSGLASGSPFGGATALALAE